MKTANVKNAFETGRRGSVPAYADESGVVRVYDSIAGHYTTVHSLTEGQQAYVRRMTQPKPTAVVVTRCDKCGLEHTMFSAYTGECPRCGNTRHTQRQIRNPHPDTAAQAERETEVA